MAYDREQHDKLMELLGEGPTRRIRVTVLFALALSGVALQGLVYWYAARAANEDWGTGGMQFGVFVVGAWFLTVGLLLALLLRRLKDMREGTILKG